MQRRRKIVQTKPIRDPVRQQARQRVRVQVVLPLVVAALVIFAGVPLLLLMTMNTSAAGFDTRVGTAASFMAALFILLPLMLVCFVPYVLLLGGVLGMTVVNRRAPRLLGGTRNLTYRLNNASKSLSRLVAAPVIAVSKRAAWLEKALGFEPPRAK